MKWEYKVVKYREFDEKMANELGASGWELVGFEVYNAFSGWGRFDRKTKSRAIFKREVK